MRELGVSIDTLKKEVGTFIRKRKTSGKVEGGEARSKRIKVERGRLYLELYAV